MQPSQSGHARRSHNHSRSSNLTPSPSSGKEPPPLQPSRSEIMHRNMNPFGQTQTQQKPDLPQQQSSFDVLSAPTKKIKPNQNSFAENVRGVPHDVRFGGEKDLTRMEREPNTDMTEHDYQVKISSLKHIIGEGQHMKPQDIAQKGQHLPQGMDSVWNKRSNPQVLSQFPGEKNRFLEDPMLKEEDVPSHEMDNTGLIIPSLKKPSANFTGNNDILPLSNLYSQLKRQQMEQQLLQQQQQQQQQHLAMLQARQQLLVQQQEAKLIQQHMMKQIQPLDLYLQQQQQQQQQLARQFQQNFNKYDQMSLINARKMGSQDVSDMLASHQHPVFQYNNMLLAQQQRHQAGLNPHLASGLNQRLNFNRQGENESEISTNRKNLEATEKIANKMMIPELKYEDTIIKREEMASASESSSKLPPSRKKNSISSLEDNNNNNNKKNQKSSAATIESTPASHATDNTKESGRARRKNKWQMLAEQQAQQPKGNEGIDLGELDPVQIARSNTVYIEGVSEEKCTDCDFLLKVIITDDSELIGHANAKNDFKAITEYSLENRKVHSGEQYQVNVPAVSLRPSRPIRKKPLEPIWDPSAISKDELRGYFEDLSKGLNCKNINQERALKLLKRKNYKREKVQVNISKNEKFYSSFLAVAEDTAAAIVQETTAIGESEQQEEPSG